MALYRQKQEKARPLKINTFERTRNHETMKVWSNLIDDLEKDRLRNKQLQVMKSLVQKSRL